MESTLPKTTSREETWLLEAEETMTVPSQEQESRGFSTRSLLVAAGTLLVIVSLVVFTTSKTPLSNQFSRITHPTLEASSHHHRHHSPCGDLREAVSFADMHDGDVKIVSIQSGDQLTIQPAAEGETWTVSAQLDASTCTALVDFAVPGKPSPPPVPLLLTIWRMEGMMGRHEYSKLTMEFTDPSGTIASKGTPLNHWVQLGTTGDEL